MPVVSTSVGVVAAPGQLDRFLGATIIPGSTTPALAAAGPLVSALSLGVTTGQGLFEASGPQLGARLTGVGFGGLALLAGAGTGSIGLAASVPGLIESIVSARRSAALARDIGQAAAREGRVVERLGLPPHLARAVLLSRVARQFPDVGELRQFRRVAFDAGRSPTGAKILGTEGGVIERFGVGVGALEARLRSAGRLFREINRRPAPLNRIGGIPSPFARRSN